MQTGNVLLVLLLSASTLGTAGAQTASVNWVAFHELPGVKPISEPPVALRRITAELAGTLVGQLPNTAIEFVLALKNTGDQEVRIADPLDSLFLRFVTLGDKLITVPHRLPKAVMNVRGDKTKIPFPAPIEVRQIVQGTSVSYQKEEVMTIQPGEKLQIIFDTQPVVMEKIKAALQSETGASARSFKARAGLALLSRTPGEPGGRSVTSDWLSFSF